jgi:hypothetical protein
MVMNYKILRPPLTPTYELPTRKELFRLKDGDLAKLTFQVGDEGAERMWVILTDCSDIDTWKGQLDNDPIGKVTQKHLKPGMIVEFHPLDIIATSRVPKWIKKKIDFRKLPYLRK